MRNEDEDERNEKLRKCEIKRTMKIEKIRKLRKLRGVGGPPTLPTPHILLVIVILLSRFLVEVLPEHSLHLIIIGCWSHIRNVTFKVHFIDIHAIGTKILT